MKLWRKMLAATLNPTRKRRKSRRGVIGRAIWFGFRWGLRSFVVLVLLVAALRWINPPINIYQAQEWMRLGSLKRDWTALSSLPDHVALSAAAAEDAKFCEHHGFDLVAIQAAFEDQSRLRGGSTISQQLAKNVFLWQDRSWLRKGLEAGFTILIELTWDKRRIMEVYLNVVEFDEGVFGVGAAAPHYFGRSASNLSTTQAARLMAILPAPKSRSASRPGNFTQKRARSIAAGAKTLKSEGRATCLLQS